MPTKTMTKSVMMVGGYHIILVLIILFTLKEGRKERGERSSTKSLNFTHLLTLYQWTWTIVFPDSAGKGGGGLFFLPAGGAVVVSWVCASTVVCDARYFYLTDGGDWR